MKYELVIFDLDGTILNTLEDLQQSCNYVLSKYNLNKVTLEDVRKNIGWGIRHLIYELSNHSEYIDQMFEEYKKYYSLHFNDFTKPYDDINKVIDFCLNNNIRIGVYTNKVESIAKTLCDYHFNGKFEFVYGDVLGRVRKPEASFIESVIEELKIEKEKILYIGDSEVDIKTAENANIDGLFVTYGYRPKEELFKYSDKIIDKVLEIIDYLK